MSYLANPVFMTISKKNIIKYFHGYSNKLGFSRILSMSTNLNSATNIFNGKVDRYKGIIIDSQNEGNVDFTEFSKRLTDSLKVWSDNEYRGIWFKVHLNQSDWVPELAKNGFKYHHAKEEYVMMYKWLPKTENCNIPPFAHTMLGVGAVVTNDANELLIVQEKYKISDTFRYKLPGGYVEPGENIVDAAIREVHEETNVMTEFQSVLTLRHTHGSQYNCSDVYVVVHLKALSKEITKCEREIAEARWMGTEEFLRHSGVTQLNKFFVRKYLEYKENGIKINCFHGVHEILNKAYTMYSVTKNNKDDHEKDLENLKTKM
ncbi:unnamed protein product [Phyllotreta striolata]|uniref:Nudix hydrolase domain-containing protein n=1 Tax=Phyllotreta striolata TaxID=444603 RepID=A0A9N9TZT3_PHYSR|nr:unnamed protein product [Phyllotreta striolata]